MAIGDSKVARPRRHYGADSPLSGYVEVLVQVLRHLAVITQIPPYALLASLTSLAADALDAAEDGLPRRVGERRTFYGEYWEQVLRCACAACSAETLPGGTTPARKFGDYLAGRVAPA